ncbi:MAG: hypothetical protein RJB55_374, partial [Verrucomicrobiota bacterium]
MTTSDPLAESPACLPLPSSRRSFLRAAAAAGATLASGGAPWVRAQSADAVLGQGKFRYRLVPGWGQLGPSTPVKDCHGIVRDREGHLILLTNHTSNNVIVFDRTGRLVHKWGTRFPGAHG